ITGAIKDALRREDTFTRTQREKIKRVTSAIDSLGEDFSEEAIASKLGIDLSSYQTLLEEISPVITTSVEELLEEKGLEIADNRDTIEDKIIEDETRELLAKAIKRLTDKEKQILNLYYYEGLTLKQIGGILGLTESRVSQLHSQIRLKLRGFIKNE
ncbi:MAG TPA: sigma-70 family RNA polymerase sigma factor, partial [bacterium]|nr:sigma-70 family RNA polymerase sigma factor [bacterium]